MAGRFDALRLHHLMVNCLVRVVIFVFRPCKFARRPGWLHCVPRSHTPFRGVSVGYWAISLGTAIFGLPVPC